MKKKRGIIISIIVLIVIGIITFLLINNGKKELQINTSASTKGNIEITVMATGYVQPVEEVEVGTQVSGVIEKIYVDYNSVVKKGQLLAELDKMTLQEKLTQAKASLSSANSDLSYAQQNYTRTKDLYDNKAATLVSYEEATNKLTQAQTAVENANANLHQAEVNLSYAYIYSPINGVVLDRSVNTGQTVAASFNTPTLFTIAEDLTKMQVEADVDEADIGQIKLGQKVTFTVDAFNEVVFSGTVSQIRLQPTVTNNVVTYTVIIEAPNPEEKLYPGMTASVTIVVQSEEGLLIPLEALNFRMTPEFMKKMGATENPPVKMQHNQSRSGQQMVWVTQDGKAQPRSIQTGINDGISVIVKSGLSEGEHVILSAAYEKKKKDNNTATNPFMPRPPGRGGR